MLDVHNIPIVSNVNTGVAGTHQFQVLYQPFLDEAGLLCGCHGYHLHLGSEDGFLSNQEDM